MHSVCILIYESILLQIYSQYIWTGCRRGLRAIRGAPENDDSVNSRHDRANLQMQLQIEIE